MSAGRTSGAAMRRRRTAFEWALLVVSLAAILAVVAGLALSGLTGPDGAADLRVKVADTGVPDSGGRVLEVTVTNVGGSSASEVLVEVTAGSVTREVHLDLVAKGDTELAAVVVPVSVAGELGAEVVSYRNR